ncbi:radical SAM protein [Thermoproteus tenax]|uniref:Fe-S oxidoreductase n=1 Tax=Thermoproteus tenax (strain ATCC 35583 / DSM 2078 / JCM 9277 / NBRC 100435 / Kra 1) TaxID=768679 RepID=G4RP57_THETK|nr:radical SAM protein [Thermoproteus tenax]CCC81352.1 Fe-S oxidoreductase [Thermoproteus tenax Kra 1]
MRIAIVDGYTDEPAGLGVPPYIDVYPRYIAGAVKAADPGHEVRYFTIDSLRGDWAVSLRALSRYDMVVVIAGITTPGKYLGGTPITYDEIVDIGRLEGPIKILGGPVARYGYGGEGGTAAVPPAKFKRYYHIVATGDVDLVVYEALKYGIERARPSSLHDGYKLVEEFAVKGAFIVQQHPNYGWNLTAEIETYKGCPRYVSGGCSFCTTVAYGAVQFRRPEDVVAEVEALRKAGVAHFRLGRQADFYAYMAKDTGKEDLPRPNVEAIERLLAGIRGVAPDLETLHIDNVNPGTVAKWPAESAEITKLLMKYGTPGNVAAMGIETADPRVVKINNLKVGPEEALAAIRLISTLGSARGANGMPWILPGINFVLGLPGETKETYEMNKAFLQRVLEEGLMVRRVNIRQLAVYQGTRLWGQARKLEAKLRERKGLIHSFKRWVRENFDRPMLARVAPRGIVLRGLYAEQHYGGGTYARQAGSYPLLAFIPAQVPLKSKLDVVVVEHGFRSILAIPHPLSGELSNNRRLKRLARRVNASSPSSWQSWRRPQ